MPEQNDDDIVDFQRLGQTTDLASGLTRASQACVKLIDLDSRLTAMTPAGRELMEIEDFSSVCGLQWSTLWPETERRAIEEAVAEALQGRTVTFTAFCPTFKGTPKWWDVTVLPIHNAAGEIVQLLSASYDVTHLHERQSALESELAESQQVLSSLAEQLNAETRRLLEAQARVRHAEQLKVLGEFVGHVVHDMNNVFAVLQSASRILKRQIEDPNTRTVLDEVDKSLSRGTDLVRRLLDFARTKGTIEEAFDPKELIETDRDLLKHLVGDDIELELDAAAGVWPVKADKVHFQSVVFNLASNARDAIDGGGKVSIRLRNVASVDRPSALDDGDYVVVQVEDDGRGMPPDVLQRAGNLFFTTKGEGKGNGLGLASAYDLAERSGGAVLIDSEVGKGTVVSVYMPRAVPESARPTLFRPSQRHATVLIVKRDPVMRQMLAGWLRRHNLVVLEASSDTAALATVLRGIPIDVVVADTYVGLMDPQKFAETIRRQSGGLPFIFIRSADEANPAVADTVLVRPVTEAALVVAVHQALSTAAGAATE